MNKICTLIEESLKLIELGIDVNTADMYYPNRVGGHNYPLPIECKRGLPLLSQEIYAWSLSALLALIPDKIVVYDENYFLNFTKKSVDYKGIVTWDGQKCISKKAENLLDAAFKMVCWLKENKKI